MVMWAVPVNLRSVAVNWVSRAQVFARSFDPEVRARRATQEAVEDRLREFVLRQCRGSTAPAGKTLIDGMWYNANFWYRLSLFRAATGSATGEEVGILGSHNAGRAAKSFARLGIGRTRSFPALVREARAEAIVLADRALAATRSADDILNWRMPMGFPAVMVYDGFLKYQRLADVNIKDKSFRADTIEAFANCLAAERLIDEEMPSQVILTHAIHFTYASIAWAAMKKGVPAFVLWGNYGAPRLFRLSCPDDFFDFNNGLSAAEIDSLPTPTAAALREIGKTYLTRRFAGLTDDLGGQLAFVAANNNSDRRPLTERLGMKAGLPMVAVYASNWFDFPHGCGMTRFRDFRDWLEATIAVAIETPNVNWIFKPHPADAWYGGISLADLMPAKMPTHLALLPDDVTSAEVRANADALVTVHSTGGLEFASEGKPVLLADRGWYDRAGLAVVATSRADYLAKLREPWWTQIEPKLVRDRSLIFAAAHFCSPSWQNELLMKDDSHQDALWPEILALLDRDAVVEREVGTIAAWLRSGHPRYHLYKMMQGGPYGLGNAA